VKSYKKDCFHCQLFISVTSRVLDKMYIKRERLVHSTTDIGEKQQAEANSNKKRLKRRLWTKSWLLRRPLYGQYEKLLHELTAEDIPGYRNFLWMNPEMFHELLARVRPKIEKPDTFWRKALGWSLA